MHHFLRGQEGGEAKIPVPARAGHGDGHRRGLDVVRDFGQSDKVIGPKGIVEGVEFPPNALKRGADDRGAVFRIFHIPPNYVVEPRHLP